MYFLFWNEVIFNSKNILEDPNNIWKLYNSILNGKKSNEMTLKENGRTITDNSEISNIMNEFFKQKVLDIKNSVVSTEKDPLEK